ncbi:hypothetical protein DSCW_04680 [Desulfosarcina widdelii]|uniref:AB hydrolase-1 domain-containing protein n=1 Tax=Desulfosarcina widdelii TaxID=947919 RepID=A0A5K7Z0R8_9BACT|nr:hypothetical protein [Desulfosarcina widdelii]BBO73051.1 hypothetical protein DSCW_04680 [Desulfosarcina widdelii]
MQNEGSVRDLKMIYILPGMGANANMYSGPWREITDAKFIDWPKYNGERTISEVAESVIRHYAIMRSDSVAGSSLGGIVSLDIADKLGIRNVYLFGSAVSKSEINPLLRLLSPLSEITPIKFLQAIAGKFENEILTMFSSTETEFIRTMCHALSNWQGYEGDQSIIKRIHGEKDKILSFFGVCKKIKNGGHLIGMTHAIDCIEIISQYSPITI